MRANSGEAARPDVFRRSTLPPSGPAMSWRHIALGVVNCSFPTQVTGVESAVALTCDENISKKDAWFQCTAANEVGVSAKSPWKSTQKKFFSNISMRRKSHNRRQ